MQYLNNPFNNVAVRPKFDKIKFLSIMYTDNTDNVTRQLMYNDIYDDVYRKHKGWGLANNTITKEGMTTDEIQEVLKKKTHHDISTLLP